MTDQQRLSVKDYIDRMVYLAFQMRATHSFAPIKVLNAPDKPHILLDDKNIFDEIQQMYGIGDEDVRITATEIATHYIFRISDSVDISYINLKEKINGDE